jgi:uncharacterized phiE125 gp8 family phage protein
MSTLVVVTPPSDPIPTLEEVKAHLRVDFDDDDDDLTSKIWGAITEFEDPQLGWLGRSILARQVELRLDGFCSDAILLLGAPLLDVPDDDLVVVYDDAAGVEQTLSGSVYRVLDAETGRARLALKTSQSWPQTSSEAQSVRVRYWVGYQDDDIRIHNFKSAVKLHVEMTYDGTTEARDRLSETIASLLQPYRVYR